ncbi:MAG TPA: N,N-dimethylformamidase beta subunit family domain-containing protein [Gaiellaceae bacterium]|nr:N,N-dimethylformamidase beta subunit family domain-containing protein [Gaiellaceae bacterium]
MTHRRGHWQGSRRGLLGFAGAGGLLLLARGTRAFARTAPASLLGNLRVVNGGRPFSGDRPLLATVGSKDRTARVSFTLARRATVTLAILQTGQGVASELPTKGAEGTLRTARKVFGAGHHTLDWTPATTLAPRTYIARISARSLDGRVETKQAVVRLLGIDAAFSERSAAPGTEATLVVRTDASALTVQMLRSGPETVPTYANNVINGISVGGPVQVDWSQNGGAPAAITVPVGSDWPSGVYAAQITGDDGRRGFAPLVVRPAAPQARVAVVLPTSTWAAYNFYDANGDGWGDTWYAHWKTNDVDLTRPHSTYGVPYRYRSYDLGFQHWLAQTGKHADIMSDEDLELFATPADLRTAYDLLVFPGHTEYVTGRVYDLVEGFRDKGGNLMFLAANNFFRKVVRADQRQTLVDEWRDLGRPESALLGNQYIASDRGQRRAPFTVVGADVAPWAFDGTGLTNGATFGLYGIEIDARSPASPASTQVLATIPDLFGPGRTAEMTYYEHWSGARVFSAGALDFGGQMLLWPQTARIVENVWSRLAPR